MEENKVEVKEESSQDQKRVVKNIAIVLISNIISLMSGILIGFIIPKIMGISEYGYYKTFTLYSSYIGLLHFGFIDGVYLKFAGQKYEDLAKEKFRTYTKYLFLLELGASSLLLALSFFFIQTEYFLIILFVAINVFATNVITYFEFISQITMRFKRITVRNIIRCALNIVSVLVLYLLYRFNNVVIYNYIFVIITLAITYVLAGWYIYSYRDITFGKSNSFKEEKEDILYFFKVGVILLMSNLAGQLLFVVDQQFVNIAFDNDTYSIYAFAYNMINLITVATTAVATVLYPTLKRMDEKTITDNYSRLNSYLLIFVAFCLILYFPLVLVINYLLPDYAPSLTIFRIILPGVLLSSSISAIKYNCYKTFGKIINYFLKSIVILALAVIADLIVYLIFKNTYSISIVSIFVLFVWYMVVEYYFIHKYKVKWIKNTIYVLLSMGGFYGVTFIPNVYIGFASYFAFYILVTLLFFYPIIKDTFNKLRGRKQVNA